MTCLFESYYANLVLSLGVPNLPSKVALISGGFNVMSCQQDDTGCTGKINATFEGKFKILNSCDVAEKNPLPMQMTTFHIHTVSSLPPLGVIAATAALSLSLSLLHLCPPIPRVGSVAAPEFPKQDQGVNSIESQHTFQPGLGKSSSF